MSKKNQNVALVQSQALANPEVKSVINLNMNQNDVVDIAIQERLSVLEEQIKVSDAKLKEKAAENNALIKSLIDGYTKKVLDKNKGYNSFYRIIKSEGLELSNNGGEGSIMGYDNVVGKEYKNYNFDDRYNETKKPVTHAKKYMTLTKVNIMVPTSLSVGLNAHGFGFSISWNSNSISVTDAFKKKYQEKVLEAANELADLQTAHYDLRLEALEYEHGEKKIKALVLKKSLSKSKEGQAILAMLQDATQIKLLS